MNKPLIYLDQNILGLYLNGALKLDKVDSVQWVFSKEHFAEIRRSDAPQKYLDALSNINAKLLALKMENWKISGQAELIEAGNPHEQYAEYLESTGQDAFNNKIFDGLQVWMNGGGNEEILRAIPQQYLTEIQLLSAQLPAELQQFLFVGSEPKFSDMIDQMISHGNDIKQTRLMLGDGKGLIGSITGEAQLLQIWNIIQPSCGSLTSDQFFGFDQTNKQDYNSVPLFLGIVSCCAVLDIIGFNAEKKSRNLEKIPNVRSDATHIGMGAYCTAILSADRRLARRAKAIYEYKKISTASILVEAINCTI